MRSLLLAATGLLLVAGCSSGPAPDESKFLTDIRQRAYFKPMPDARLLDLGNEVCKAMDFGANPATELAPGFVQANPEANDADAGFLIAIAVSDLCSEHKEEADRAFGQE
jgi:hypothetical protein